jgi:hypothetical protein
MAMGRRPPCGRGSVVEHLIAKERVVGSNPIARFARTATWPSGKAWVCKTLITGSNPVVALSRAAGIRAGGSDLWSQGAAG